MVIYTTHSNGRYICQNHDVANLFYYFTSRLPEVPSLSEVPYITTDLTDDLYKEIQSLVSNDGRIFERAPVQITEVEERPGALLVKWEEVSIVILHQRRMDIK